MGWSGSTGPSGGGLAIDFVGMEGGGPLITCVGLSRASRPGDVRALGYAVLDASWMVNGIRVLERRDGSLTVRLPQQRTANGLKEVVRPLTAKDRAAITSAVLNAYAQLVRQPNLLSTVYHPLKEMV